MTPTCAPLCTQLVGFPGKVAGSGDGDDSSIKETLKEKAQKLMRKHGGGGKDDYDDDDDDYDDDDDSSDGDGEEGQKADPGSVSAAPSAAQKKRKKQRGKGNGGGSGGGGDKGKRKASGELFFVESRFWLWRTCTGGARVPFVSLVRELSCLLPSLSFSSSLILDQLANSRSLDPHRVSGFDFEETWHVTLFLGTKQCSGTKITPVFESQLSLREVGQKRVAAGAAVCAHELLALRAAVVSGGKGAGQSGASLDSFAGTRRI